jgi:hypothetical protein
MPTSPVPFDKSSATTNKPCTIYIPSIKTILNLGNNGFESGEYNIPKPDGKQVFIWEPTTFLCDDDHGPPFTNDNTNIMKHDGLCVVWSEPHDTYCKFSLNLDEMRLKFNNHATWKDMDDFTLRMRFHSDKSLGYNILLIKSNPDKTSNDIFIFENIQRTDYMDSLKNAIVEQRKKFYKHSLEKLKKKRKLKEPQKPQKKNKKKEQKKRTKQKIK